MSAKHLHFRLQNYIIRASVKNCKQLNSAQIQNISMQKTEEHSSKSLSISCIFSSRLA